MNFGIVELITLLMGISGFSVGTNPKAPTVEQSLEYALPDADFVAHVDVGSLVPANYKVLTNLPNNPQIKANPELAKAVKKMVAEIEGPRGLVKGMTGIDLTTDISDATAFIKVVPRQDPMVVVAAHGKFSIATIDKVAKVAGKTSVKAGAGAWFDAGDGNAVAVTKNGTLLAGSLQLVQDRMADAWKGPALTAGTQLGNAADVLRGKPVFAVVMSLSATARADALSEIKGKNFLSDVIKRHKMWSFSVYRDGIGWSWIDSSAKGVDTMEQMSHGAVDILRAAQIAPRGFAKIVLGALDSYKGTNRQIDQMIARKGDIQKIVSTYTGDGQFKADVQKDAKAMKLTVRLTGKSLSEVMPLGGLLPVSAMFLLVGRESPTGFTPVPQATTPARPLPPAKKQPAPAQKRP